MDQNASRIVEKALSTFQISDPIARTDLGFEVLASAVGELLGAEFIYVWDVRAAPQEGTIQAGRVRARWGATGEALGAETLELPSWFGSHRNLHPAGSAYPLVVAPISEGPRFLIGLPIVDERGDVLWYARGCLKSEGGTAAQILAEVRPPILEVLSQFRCWWLRSKAALTSAVLEEIRREPRCVDSIPALRVMEEFLGAKVLIHVASRGRLSPPMGVAQRKTSQLSWDLQVLSICTSERCDIRRALLGNASGSIDSSSVRLCELHNEASDAKPSLALVTLAYNHTGEDLLEPMGVVEFRRGLGWCPRAGVPDFSAADLSLIDHLIPALRSLLHAVTMRHNLTDRTEIIVHEVASPLHAIWDRATLLDRHWDDFDEIRRRTVLADIKTDSRILMRLIQSLEVASGLGRAPSLEPCLLFGDVILKIRSEIAPLLHDRGFSLRAIEEENREVLPPLMLDPILMNQVFYNLIINAVKYAFTDPAAFSVVVSANRVDAGFEIAVKDRGIGVPERDRERIFQEGFRSKNARERVVVGTGLGLTVARRLLEMQGCAIMLSSASRPTVFTISIPARAPGEVR